MTLLVGQQGVGWTTASANDFVNNASALAFQVGYTAVASGVMSNAHITCGATQAGIGNLQVVVYAGIGTSGLLVAVSSAITYSSNSDVFAAISGNIVAGNQYTLVVSASAGGCDLTINSGSSAFVGERWNAATFPFSSPPNPLPAQTDGANHEFIVWIDGASSADPLASQICI